MRKIILIRHGSIDSRYEGCYIGSTDVALSEKGLRDAEAVGRYIADMDCDHIFASPMLRVRQTLETALTPEKAKTVEYNENIREIDFGDWEGKNFSQIKEKYPEEVEDWAVASDQFTFPGGSNLGDFRNRIETFKNILLETPGTKIIVFAHGGVILALIHNILGLEKEKMLAFKADRGSISSLELFDNGYGILTGLNLKPGEKIWQM